MTRKFSIRRNKIADQTSAARKARNIVLVAAVATLSTVGTIAVAGPALSAPAQKLTICHGTNSNTNPYNEISPSINATGLHAGHITHTGPIWDPTLKAQHIAWGDIIPPFDYTDASNVVTHYPGLNWTVEGQAILNNGCNIPAVVPTTVSPEDPTVTQSVCNSDNHPTVPSVTFATTAGILYSVAPNPVAGGSSIVTATATAGNQFIAPPPAGWTFVDSTHETFAVDFDAAPTCSGSGGGGKIEICHRTNSNTNPYVDISPSKNGVINGHEKHTGPVWDPTLKAQHIKWGDIIPPFDNYPGMNWDAAGQQIFANGCDIPTTAVPNNPTVTQSVCTGDPAAPSVPTVTFPATPGVSYSIAPAPVAGGSSTVTATADAPAFWFQPPPPAGWTFVDLTHETFQINFDAAPDCSVPPTVVAPTNPGVTNAICNTSTGVVSAPSLTLANTPAGVAYSVSAAAPYAAGQSVTVTATADGTHAFEAPAPAGWTFVDSQHETFAVSFTAAPSCGSTGPLANTGVPTGKLATFGGIVLVLGLGMQFMGSRRRRVTA